MKNATLSPGLSSPGVPDLPDHIRIIDNKTLMIRIGIELDTEIWREITFKNITTFFAAHWGSSGVRQLGPITGDWRYITKLAGTCHSIFVAIRSQPQENNDFEIIKGEK